MDRKAFSIRRAAGGRGCPPALREQRDWDALPQSLRDEITTMRGIWNHLQWVHDLEITGAIYGDLIIYRRSVPGRKFCVDPLFERVIHGVTPAQILVHALKGLGVEPPEVI